MELRLKIEHKSVYRFSKPIFLEPHFLQFRPSDRPYLRLESFELTLDPEPSGLHEMVSNEGNQVQAAWFNGQTRQLEIEAVSILQITAHNPFGFLVFPASANELPLKFSGEEQKLLELALAPIDDSEEVKNFAKEIAEAADHQTLKLCSKLTQTIYGKIGREPRHLGPPLTPSKTLEQRNGSCRDLSYLAMAVFRQLGIPARFVSGYHFAEGSDDHELHAWVEAYIPGAGWKGYDPSIGLATVQNHIPVATSVFPAKTMPVTGTFRGEATSELESWVSVSRVG